MNTGTPDSLYRSDVPGFACRSGKVRDIYDLGDTLAIVATDCGVRFTAVARTGRVERAGTRVSTDGWGRCHDNIFIEQLWRSVKYEDIDIRGYETLRELEVGLRRYFGFYNGERHHQSLKNKTPARGTSDFMTSSLALQRGCEFRCSIDSPGDLRLRPLWNLQGIPSPRNTEAVLPRRASPARVKSLTGKGRLGYAAL